MIEAIVFDMDGILFDTERLSVESWVEVAGKMGLGDIDKGVYGCIGLNRTDCRIFLKETYGQDFPYEYFREQTAAVFQKKVDKDGLPVMKGAQELLLWLQEKGIKVALASSTHTKKVESHLRLAGFTGFFQAVIGRAQQAAPGYLLESLPAAAGRSCQGCGCGGFPKRNPFRLCGRNAASYGSGSGTARSGDRKYALSKMRQPF